MTDTPLSHDRPLGYWLRSLDALLTREFARVLHAEGVDRRDWMILNVLDDSVDAPPFAERVQRGGKRVRALAERGWVTESDGRWTLTDEGRAAKTRLSEAVDGIRATVAGAVSPDDYATTMASLEAMARALGADDVDAESPRGRDALGFGPRFGPRGFGPRGGFDPRAFGPRGFGPRGFGPRGFDPRGFRAPGFDGPGFEAHGDGAHGDGRHGDRPHGFPPHAFPPHAFPPHAFPPHAFPPHAFGPHDRDRRADRHIERAYERGFEAGFTRGRES
ncbi:hypothetical protein [Microbacterium sp.]|uniref:MarR family winged helix-turn-helix transcriptional regulator n=1 Tax=Microbacterium sp. TaxID=51671 RepID=UPI0039E6F18A